MPDSSQLPTSLGIHALSAITAEQRIRALSQPWCLSWRADPVVSAFADRHYSRKTPGATQFAPPGRIVVLRTLTAAWVSLWPKAEYVDHGWPGAWLCTLFRNEGPSLSSDLIRWAVAATRAEWPEAPAEGMVTFIDPKKTRHKRDPGRCFRKAGFREVGRTKGGLVALQLLPSAMPDAAPCLGSQTTLWEAVNA